MSCTETKEKGNKCGILLPLYFQTILPSNLQDRHRLMKSPAMQTANRFRKSDQSTQKIRQ